MAKDTTDLSNLQQDTENNLNPFSGDHHSFDIKIAEKYGMSEAILIHHFLFWIRLNVRKGNKKTFQDGRMWSYQTLEEITSHFPYFTKEQVRDLIERLCTGKSRRTKKEGLDFDPVLLKGNFNTHSYDRTTWYSFIDEAKWQIPKCIWEDKNPVGTCPDGKRELPSPLPDTKTDSEDLKESKLKLTKENPSDLPVSFGKFVKLEKASYDELCTKQGKERIDDTIEQINDYLASTGKKPYKDYAATIRQWIRRAKPNTGSSPNTARPPSQIDTNLQIIQKLKLDNPGVFDHMHTFGKNIVNSQTKEDMYLDINSEIFKEAFIKLSKVVRRG